MLKIRRNLLTFIHSRASLENSTLFKNSRERHRIQHFEQYLYFNFLDKNIVSNKLALLLAEIEADRDRQALDADPQK
jgi:hypothetical protein